MCKEALKRRLDHSLDDVYDRVLLIVIDAAMGPAGSIEKPLEHWYCVPKEIL